MSALSSFRPVRPAGRRDVVRLPKLHVPISAYVVDCAVYVDGQRLPGRWTHDRRLAEVRRARRGLRLDRPARAGRGADQGHRRGLRAARAGRGGRGARPPAAQAGALRRHAVHGAQDGLLRRARAADHGQRDRRDRRDHGLRRPRLRDHGAARRALLAAPACGAPWRPTRSSSRWARPPCCTPSPTTWWTTTSRSPRPSRTTSTRWRPRSSPRAPRWTPSRST